VSDTVLEQPLVRWYLRELDKASLTLPAAQARELREQIAAHLDEALPPGATDEQVRDEIGRLGSARSLVAAAAGPGSRSLAARTRVRLARVRWWTWVSVAAVAVLAGSALSYALLALDATPLIQGFETGWYYPQDRALSVTTQAGNVTQYTVPDRFGQEQGIVVSIVNNSDWTQTVLGVAPRWYPFTFQPAQVAVGSGQWADHGSSAGQVTWSSPGSIPPHSIRVLRVLWKSDVCMGTDGGWASTQDVPLTVRVGIFTRTEDVPLLAAFALTGTKASAACH
jgi:hypothetical protein